MLTKELAFIERFKARASHAAQVQSRVKKLDKIEKVEPPKVRKTVDFEFRARAALRRGRREARAASTKRYGSRTVYDGLDFLVRRGERWCVMGANGAGQVHAAQAGRRRDARPTPARSTVGASVKMGYFAQHAMELLDRREHRLGDAPGRVPPRLDRLAAHARRLLRLLRRRDREALPRALRRREGAARARADALRPAELPRPRRADEPPRRRDEGDARAGARRLRGDDALRLARPALPRARSRTACSSSARRGRSRYGGGYTEYVARTGREAPGLRAAPVRR